MGGAVGIVAKVAAPVIKTALSNFASGMLSGMLEKFLGGAKNAGGASGLGNLIGNLVSCFPGGQVINAATNLLNNIMGNSIKDAVNTLAKDHGLPKFVAKGICRAVDQEVSKANKKCDLAVQNALNDGVKHDAQETTKNLANDLLKEILNLLKERFEGNTKETGAAEKSAGKGGKVTAKSWIAMIAEALGKVQGQKAQEMMQLTNKVSNISEQQVQNSEDGMKFAGVTEKNAKGSQLKDKETNEKEKEKLAAEMTKAQAELQGVQQEYKLISETTSTVLKTLGEALSGMARKQ